jgi:hypothetical protein
MLSMKRVPILVPLKRFAKVALPISSVRMEALGMSTKPWKLSPRASPWTAMSAEVTCRPLKPLRPETEG